MQLVEILRLAECRVENKIYFPIPDTIAIHNYLVKPKNICRDARGKRYGDICICITDSLCYKAETNTIVKPLYSNKDVKKIKNTNQKNIYM